MGSVVKSHLMQISTYFTATIHHFEARTPFRYQNFKDFGTGVNVYGATICVAFPSHFELGLTGP